MMVRNWMQANPMTIPSDTLVSDAKRLLSEHNLHALLLRMGHFVLRTQDADEFNFFVNRLRVRDVMVRNPATVSDEESMQECLRRGRELQVAQFPVMHGGQVVGIISANEIFALAAHCLSKWQDHEQAQIH